MILLELAHMPMTNHLLIPHLGVFKNRLPATKVCSFQVSHNFQGIDWILKILIVITHQIFSLARNWSKHVMWPNIPQLKLGNIREYSPILKTARVAEKI